MGNWCRTLAEARYLRRRCHHYARPTNVVVRLSDGALFAASCPENMGAAMVSLFDRTAPQFTFVRVREWRGLLIVSPRLWWMPRSGEFRLLGEMNAFWLHRWPANKEDAVLSKLAAEYRQETAA